MTVYMIHKHVSPGNSRAFLCAWHKSYIFSQLVNKHQYCIVIVSSHGKSSNIVRCDSMPGIRGYLQWLHESLWLGSTTFVHLAAWVVPHIGLCLSPDVWPGEVSLNILHSLTNTKVSCNCSIMAVIENLTFHSRIIRNNNPGAIPPQIVQVQLQFLEGCSS